MSATSLPTRRPHPPSLASRLRFSGGGFVTHIFMIAIVFMLLLPILWMISTSFKNAQEFFTNSAALIPHSISLVNYEYMFSAIQELPLYMTNSFVLAIGVAVLQVVAAALAGTMRFLVWLASSWALRVSAQS